MNADRLRRSAATLLLALVGSACACTGPRETVNVHGVVLVVDAWSVERDEADADGYLLKAFLRERAEVDGFVCERWIRFWSDDVLAQCQLAEDALVAGHTLPAGSTLWFDREGRIETVWLAADTVIDGVPCNGGPGKIAASFHPNGRLRTAFLVRDQEIDGVPCLASVFHPVEFDEDGRLVACTLAGPFEHDGARLGRGDELRR